MQLGKNQTMNLAKNGTSQVFRIGASWEKRGKKFLGIFGGKKESVDLDLCTFAAANGRIAEECHFKRPRTSYMVSSGDDRSGGVKDGDNETITIDMSKVPDNVEAIVIVINSFSGETFDEINVAKVRVYEGPVNQPTKVHCSYDMAAEPSFIGGRTLIIGSLFKSAEGWNFKAMGEMRKYRYIEDFKREVEGR